MARRGHDEENFLSLSIRLFLFFFSKESSVHIVATVATVARGIEKRQTMRFAVRIV